MTARWLGLPSAVLLLASTHFVIDAYSNILSPLLPLFIPAMGLSLAAAGLLQTVFQMASSVAQLGFGHIADRWRPRALLVAGPLVAVAILPLVGLASGPVALATILVLGGLGAAAFHPPAAALVHTLSGPRAGLAMSVHITAGSLGFSIGPMLFAPFVQRFGIAWTPVLMLPALVALSFVLGRLPSPEAHAEHGRKGGFSALRPYAKPLTLLYLIVVLRTLTALSYSTFVPVMLTRRGMTLAGAGAFSAVFLVSSSVGGFFGGGLADRWGARRVILLSMVLSVPFFVVAPLFEGWLFVTCLATGGFLLQSTLPVNVTFGQRIAPISAATVSSLMMGFAWGSGGLLVPVVGVMADRTGIEAALQVMAFSPLLGALLALPLPARDPGYVVAHVGDGPTN
jgi:FSR family fosmidomycin resistance protein-like MFS transporter